MAPNRAQCTTFLIFAQIEIRRGKSYRSTCPGATYIEIARHDATNVVYARQISGQHRKIAATSEPSGTSCREMTQAFPQCNSQYCETGKDMSPPLSEVPFLSRDCYRRVPRWPSGPILFLLRESRSF